MTIQEPTAAPARFIRLLNKSIDDKGFSLREFARQVGVSIAYLSRLLNKQRGLPADETITRMEKTLGMDQGVLFDAAGRHDEIAAKVFKNEKMRQLLRSLEPLTDEDFAKIVVKADALAKKYHPDHE
jgi:transcriptional regulator with XRE-family HTH domain